MEGFLDRILLMTGSHRRLLRNRSFVLLWSGQSMSFLGDAFFNLAVLWVVWSETQSTLQTAIIQAVWHLPDTFFAPLAGVLADRWDRKLIMVTTNLAAASVVGAVVVVIAVIGHLPPVVAFVAILMLNSLTTFLNPARVSVMPSVVGNELLTTAQGLFSTAREIASLIGSAAAGLVIAAANVLWALVIDALSFLSVSMCVALARLPERAEPTSGDTVRHRFSARSFVRDIHDGWQMTSKWPVVRTLIWLGVIGNIAAFIGPLWPALIQDRLGGGASALGVLLAASIVGGIVGGLLAGPLERHHGAGRVMASGWSLAGVCTFGVAASVWLPLTLILEAIGTFGITVGAIASSAIMITFVPDDYRGRVFGVSRALSVAVIPASALAGGWLAQSVGVVPIYAFGGALRLAPAVIALANPRLRTARI